MVYDHCSPIGYISPFYPPETLGLLPCLLAKARTVNMPESVRIKMLVKPPMFVGIVFFTTGFPASFSVNQPIWLVQSQLAQATLMVRSWFWPLWHMVRDRVNGGEKKAQNSSSWWVRPKKRDVNCCESMVQCGPPKVNLCWFLTPWVMFVKLCSLRVSSLAGEFCPS